MVTREDIEDLKAQADAEQNDELYVSCLIALDLGPASEGWRICEKEIASRRKNG